MTVPPPTPPSSIEVIARLVNEDEPSCRQPPAGTNKLYYTATDPCIFGLDVCNIGAVDALISVYILPPGVTWEDTVPSIPSYTAVVFNLRLEADSTDGSIWTMPVKTLNAEDRVVVWSNVGNVTWFGHGFKFTGGGG